MRRNREEDCGGAGLRAGGTKAVGGGSKEGGMAIAKDRMDQGGEDGG